QETTTTETRPSQPPFDEVLRPRQGAGRRGRLEHPRSRARRRGYTPDSVWRNRDEFLTGRVEIVALLTGNRPASSTTPCARACGPTAATASSCIRRGQGWGRRFAGTGRVDPPRSGC